MASEPGSPSARHGLSKTAREIGPRQLVLSKALSLSARKAESAHNLPELKSMGLNHDTSARGSLPVLETVKRTDSLTHSSKSSPTQSVNFGELFDSIVSSSESSPTVPEKKQPKYHKVLGEMGKTRSASEFPFERQRTARPMSGDVLRDMQKLPSVDSEQGGEEMFKKITELDSLFGSMGMVGPGGSTTGAARYHKYALGGTDAEQRVTRDQLTSSQDAKNVMSCFERNFENVAM